MPDRVIKRVLAPVELSESELPDMQYAVHVAQQLGAELILFAVIDTPAMVQMIGQQEDPNNYLLMHAMAPNVAGVIGSAVGAGILWSVLVG